MEAERSCKVYVDVGAEFRAEGWMRPVWIRWVDGRIFGIDKVRYCTRAASLKAGGAGIRYTVLIGGREAQLYYEGGCKWFVEAVQG